jgi:hypothetical protein
VYPEFKDWPDFFGFTTKTLMTLAEAEMFVRPLGLKNQSEFRKWAAGRLRRHGLPVRPVNLPTNPHRTYSDVWKGYNDFLGTPKPRNIGRTWRSLEEAKEFVHPLGLKGVDEWRKYTKGQLKDVPALPADIPAWPYDTYGKEKNWKGMSDFLGSKPSAKYVEFWPFPKARKYVCSLKLRRAYEYRKWANGGFKDLPEKPVEIPAQPWVIYRNQWRGWDDWLGRDA